LPDFTPEDFEEILEEYSLRQRRFGNDKYFSHNQMNLTIIKIGGSVITDKKRQAKDQFEKLKNNRPPTGKL